MIRNGQVPGVCTGKISDIPLTEEDGQSSFLKALAKGAEELNNRGWPDGVSELIAYLGQITGVNRVWLFQVLELSDRHMLMNFPFEWVDDQKFALKKRPRFDTKQWKFDTCSPTYRALVESRRRGEWQTAVIEELDECDFKDYQTAQGVLSTVSIPVMVQNEWWGLVGLDDCTIPRRWTGEEIALLRMAAHLISTAVVHNRLSSTNRQIEILSSLTESNTWELDLNTGYCWFDSRIISHTKGLSDTLHLPLLQTFRYIHPEDLRELFINLRQCLAFDQMNFRQDLRVLRDNQYVWSEVIARISRDSEAHMEKMSGIIIDIPQRKEKEEELYRKATIDPLTGLANRGSFDNRFHLMIDRLRTDGTPFSLLLLDIDFFKKVNDTWGHNFGDQVLIHITSIIQNTLREDDFAARFGGEEFTVLLQGDSPGTSQIIAERIRKNIEETPLITTDKTVSLTISIGIFDAREQQAGLDYKAILNNADLALYTAKKNGRNLVITF